MQPRAHHREMRAGGSARGRGWIVQSLTRHPRWRLYKSLRCAVERELEEARECIGLSAGVSEAAIDDYMRVHLSSILNDLRQLFRRDLEISEARAALQIRKMLVEIARGADVRTGGDVTRERLKI